MQVETLGRPRRKIGDSMWICDFPIFPGTYATSALAAPGPLPSCLLRPPRQRPGHLACLKNVQSLLKAKRVVQMAQTGQSAPRIQSHACNQVSCSWSAQLSQTLNAACRSLGSRWDLPCNPSGTCLPGVMRKFAVGRKSGGNHMLRTWASQPTPVCVACCSATAATNEGCGHQELSVFIDKPQTKIQVGHGTAPFEAESPRSASGDLLRVLLVPQHN